MLGKGEKGNKYMAGHWICRNLTRLEEYKEGIFISKSIY